MNGRFCKNPKDVISDDFFFSGPNIPSNTNNQLGFNVTPVFVYQLPGLNTLGISVARVDHAPFGVNPPHTHPRGTEIVVVLEGIVLAGFVASDQNNHTFFYKVLYPGDVFVFPIGQVHFNVNVGNTSDVS